MKYLDGAVLSRRENKYVHNQVGHFQRKYDVRILWTVKIVRWLKRSGCFLPDLAILILGVGVKEKWLSQVVF